MRLPLLAGMACCALILPALAADGDYLFDTLKKPAYKKAWVNMIGADKTVPDWVRTGAGVATPGVGIDYNGAEYEFHHLCKPHDCADNQFEAMFAPGGARVWGYLVTAGGGARYLGNPDGAKKIALQRAIRG